MNIFRIWVASATAGLCLAGATSADVSATSLRPITMEDYVTSQSFSPEMPADWSQSGDGALAFTRLRKLRIADRNSGGDVWVQLERGQAPVNITQGARDDSDWRNARWSPDGQRLVMQSTRGGGCTLWVWDRKTRDLHQISSRNLGQKDNRAFQWANDGKVVACCQQVGAAPEAENSVDYMLTDVAAMWRQRVAGREPTASLLESGAGVREYRTKSANELRDLVVIEVASGLEHVLRSSFTPFYGAGLLLSPNGRAVAILYRGETIQGRASFRLALLDLSGKALASDQDIPGEVWPETVRWSAKGNAIAFLSGHELGPNERENAAGKTAPVQLCVSSTEGRIEKRSLEAFQVTLPNTHRYNAKLEWAGENSLWLFAAPVSSGQFAWWLVGRAGQKPERVSPEGIAPSEWSQYSAYGPLVGIVQGELWRIDAEMPARRISTAIKETFGKIVLGAKFEAFDGSAYSTDVLIAQGAYTSETEEPRYYWINIKSGDGGRLTAPASGAWPTMLERQGKYLLWANAAGVGTLAGGVTGGLEPTGLWRTPLIGGGPAETIILMNAWTEQIRKPQERIIDYTDLDGNKQYARVILPPGYRADRRYPVVTQIYPGRVIPPMDKTGGFDAKYWALAAEAGYVLLEPSVPNPEGNANGMYFLNMPKGVLPAVDKLIELGIADPGRVFVQGQSAGGYATVALLAQTKRFKAAIAASGPFDMVSFQGAFFSVAERYAVEDQSRWAYRPYGKELWENPAFFSQQSPLTYVDQIETPLLLIAGDMDGNVPMSQSEEMYTALSRLGKRVSFLRYWGESHDTMGSHMASPANLRDYWMRMLAWYDEFGDVGRDTEGNMRFENGVASSRKGAEALKSSDFNQFPIFKPTEKTGH